LIVWIIVHALFLFRIIMLRFNLIIFWSIIVKGLVIFVILELM
jgi:hypothetical protein